MTATETNTVLCYIVYVYSIRLATNITTAIIFQLGGIRCLCVAVANKCLIYYSDFISAIF